MSTRHHIVLQDTHSRLAYAARTAAGVGSRCQARALSEMGRNVLGVQGIYHGCADLRGGAARIWALGVAPAVTWGGGFGCRANAVHSFEG